MNSDTTPHWQGDGDYWDYMRHGVRIGWVTLALDDLGCSEDDYLFVLITPMHFADSRSDTVDEAKRWIEQQYKVYYEQ